MDLYIYKGRLDLAATSLADLRLLVPALDNELDPDNAATLARIAAKLPSLVQSDVAEPVRLYCYDDAGTTLSSWITDAAVTVTVGLGAPNAETTGDYTTATAAISGSSRLASLVLNTQALANALAGRRGATLTLQVRQAPANGGETVLLLPLEVLPGVISSPTNEDNAADVSAAATSAAAAAASAAAASSSAGAAAASEIATAADAVATAADRVQTGLDRSATTASAAAAAVSEAAADEDAAQTASDRTQTGLDVLSSAASALAAASSAAAAALTAAGAYQGGVAGGSVPATSTLAGDYYRITAAGTSQSKTWAVGDMAIYNGTSGSWTQLAGVLPYATAAQARAGTDTTSALNSSTGNERALLGDFTRQIRDSLYSDGSTSNRRVEWTLGTAGAVAGMAIIIPFEFQVPTSNPSATGQILVGPSATSSGANGLDFQVLRSDGGFVLRQYGATVADYRGLSYPGFRAAYAGMWIRGMVVFASPDSTTNPVVYVNGVDITAAFSANTSGALPNWVPVALDATKFSYLNFPAGRFQPHAPILGALTAAEVLDWTQTGRLPTWCEIGTGSAAGQLTNTGFETGVPPAATGWSFGSAGSSTAANVAGAGVGGTNAAVLVIDGSNNSATIAQAHNVVIGRAYLIKYTAKVDSTAGSPSIGSDVSTSIGGALTTSFVTYQQAFVATLASTSNALLKRGSNCAGRTITIDDVQLYDLGPIFKPVIQPILVVADAGANKLAGILTSGITPITDKREWLIQAATNTNGNQQLLGASLFAASTKHVIDDWCMNTAGTPTVTAGSASAGTQYKSSGALAATRNLITLVTRVLATANLWCGSNDTSTIQHTITGHVVD